MGGSDPLAFYTFETEPADWFPALLYSKVVPSAQTTEKNRIDLGLSGPFYPSI